MQPLRYIVTDHRDIDAIAPLWEMLNRHHQSITEHFAERYRGMTFDRRKDYFLKKAQWGAVRVELAMDTSCGRYIGYCVSSVSKNGEGEIDSIFVETGFRGLGIGGRLVENALDWMDQKQAKEKKVVVVEGNIEAMAFYSRYGFFPLHRVLMQRPDK